MRKVIVVLLMTIFVSSIAMGQRPDPTGKGRYTILPNASIFNSIPPYKDASSLDGLGKKTAAELGIAGEEYWNEYPEGPRLVVLSEKAVIYYDTGSFQPYYLDGCIVNGKRRPNRIVAVKKVVEKERIVETEKIIEKEVPGPVEYVEKHVPGPVQYVPVCPAGWAFTGQKASTKSRLFGGLIQAGISGVASAGITKARGGTWREAGYSTIGGVILQRGQQVFNPSADKVILSGPNGFQEIIKEGQNKKVGDGMEVVWENGIAYLVVTFSETGQKYMCSAFSLKDASNLAIWTDRTRTRDVFRTITCPPGTTPTNDGRCGVKEQLPGQKPSRPPQGPGLPPAPCRVGPNGECKPPFSTTPNTPLPGGSTPPTGGTPPSGPRRPGSSFAPAGTINNSPANAPKAPSKGNQVTSSDPRVIIG